MTRIRRCFSMGGWALGALAVAGCGANEVAVVPEAEAMEVAEGIEEAQLRERIAILAHDSMRGRDTPSPELDQVAEWIGREFEAMGLSPAFGDEYVQTYGIRRVVPDLASSSGRVGAGATEVPLGFGPDLAFALGPAAGLLQGDVSLLVGSEGAADALTEHDLSGRHVVWIPEVGGNPLRSREGRQVVRAVRTRGGLSLLMADDADDRTWTASTTLGAQLTALTLEGQAAPTPALMVRDATLRSAFELDVAALRREGGSARLEDLPLPLTLELAVNVVSEANAPNVAAWREGSDPALRDEYVVYSAHMDHVGVGAPDASGDSIWNGADDDASGTATVMEIAQAFSELPRAPRRSVLFVLVSGEEKGLWGSRFFVENAPVPVERMVANLNLDMVGRNWPDTIVAIGRDHSDLGETLESVNVAHPELGMTAIDDLWPQENFYGRSDHFNFARRGVPILFFFNGTHEDYHRPSDEVDAIDAEKAARIGRLLFYLGNEVANRDERPRWNEASYERIVEPD